MSSSKTPRPPQRVSKRQVGIRAGKRHEFDMFEPFPRLPLELRLKIWTLSLPGPQIQSSKDTYREGYIIKVPPPAQNPVTLSVNQESRALTLEHYTPRDSYKLHRYQQEQKIKYPCYVDYTRDLFVFPSKAQLWYNLGTSPSTYSDEDWCQVNLFYARDEWRKLRYVHIYSGDFSFAENQVRDLLVMWLPLFDNLKSFTYTILLEPHVEKIFKDWDGQEYVVEDKLKAYNECVKVTLERFSKDELAKGKVWEVPDFKVQTVKPKVDKAGTWVVDSQSH